MLRIDCDCSLSLRSAQPTLKPSRSELVSHEVKRIPACQKLYVLTVVRTFISRESHNTDKAILW